MERSQMSTVKKVSIGSAKSRSSQATTKAIAKNRRTPARASSVRRAPGPAPTFDLTKARADWQSACDASDAATGQYLALCTDMESEARAASAEHSKRLKAIYAEEDKLAVAIDNQDNAASTVLAAPASIEALKLKLALFSRLWARERGIDQPLDGGDVADVTAGIVLDLLALLRRGEAAEIARAA
jgi:hypothetical protein